MSRIVIAVVVSVVAFAASACTHVAAHQRARLAHPSMTVADDATAAQAHVYAVQEGAVGGAAGAESGCGCN